MDVSCHRFNQILPVETSHESIMAPIQSKHRCESNPCTVVKAIHAPFMAPFQRQIAFESKP